MDTDMVSLSGAAVVTVTAMVSAMGGAVLALFRSLLAAKEAHIQALERQLSLSQQREEAWKGAAFDSLPILAKQQEVAAAAFTLAKRRGAA